MTHITSDLLAELRHQAVNDPQLRAARNAVTQVGVGRAALDYDMLIAVQQATQIKLDTLPVTNQKRSGRCWMFAALNVFRHRAAKELNVENFEFSFIYLQYFDKLERVNLVLHELIEHKDDDLDDREVAHILDDANADGGWWNFFTSLVAKYGAVPAEVMPETHAAGDTREMNRTLATIVRRAALQVRAGADAQQAADAAIADAQRVLAVYLGFPPTEFEWSYRDKDNEFHRLTSTPREFAAKFLPDLDDYVMLGADPRDNAQTNQLYVSTPSRNVLEDEGYTYLNIDVTELRAAARRSLEADEPVWFACDVNRNFSFNDGVWDEGLLAIDLLYGIDTSTTKAERLASGDSTPTHGMVLTGFDEDAEGRGRWRVENSWGTKVHGPHRSIDNKEIPSKGYGTATDAWVDNNVFGAIVRKKYLTEAQLKGLTTQPIELPIDDRMI